MSKTVTNGDKPYGANRGAWHQVTSKSDPGDSHGHIPKSQQQVDQHSKPAAAQRPERTGTKDETTYDPREPKPRGSYDCGGATRSSVTGNSTRANKRT